MTCIQKLTINSVLQKLLCIGAITNCKNKCIVKPYFYIFFCIFFLFFFGFYFFYFRGKFIYRPPLSIYPNPNPNPSPDPKPESELK